MQGRSGLTTKTAPHTVLDAGQVAMNIDITALETAGSNPWQSAIQSSGAVLLGGTRGGSVFSPGRTIRQMPVDGAVGPVKGFDRRQTVAPTLTVNMLEITKENLALAIAAANTATVGNFTKITGGEVADTDYITNIAIATTVKGKDDPIVLVLFNCMVEESPEFTFADEDELVLPVTFSARVLASAPNTEPFSIYHPGNVTP